MRDRRRPTSGGDRRRHGGPRHRDRRPKTASVLIEVAEFTPRRSAARPASCTCFSDSSYRFERGIDRHDLEWASRRCASSFSNLAGGQLHAARCSPERPPRRSGNRSGCGSRSSGGCWGSTFRRPKSNGFCALGLEPAAGDTCRGTVRRFAAPRWRRDLTREIDLIEEVARVHGYEKIPENVPVPLAVSQTTLPIGSAERLADGLLIAAGFFEAVTLSFVDDGSSICFAPGPTPRRSGRSHVAATREPAAAEPDPEPACRAAARTSGTATSRCDCSKWPASIWLPSPIAPKRSRAAGVCQRQVVRRDEGDRRAAGRHDESRGPAHAAPDVARLVPAGTSLRAVAGRTSGSAGWERLPTTCGNSSTCTTR